MQKPFNVEYYFKLIDMFFEQSINYEMLYEKFFEVQSLTNELSDDDMRRLLTHPDYASVQSKLDKVEEVIAKLK